MHSHRSQHGLSLVELLVGSAVGLLVAAAAASVVGAHVHETRRLRLEARLSTELDAAAELVARDLRRAGHWAAAASGVRGSGFETPLANPHADIATTENAVQLGFSRDATERTGADAAEHFGFRLRNGAIEIQLGAGNWQALSDAGVLVVTGFSVTPHVDEVSLAEFCEEACPAGSSVCPPRQLRRSYDIALDARSSSDASVLRSVRQRVRNRNDAVIGRCGA